ncbi:MAG: UDP-galactopyranose mutase [Clostridia bacterium]|nr:UDP-galactopyranose mutase [Clostridia bacterium]
MKKYDYLAVGAGLFNCVFCHEMKKRGKTVLVIDRRSHIGGNVYTEPIDGINVHVYGAHIFHTSDKRVWDYVNSFAKFNHFINSPVADYYGERYDLPFNMNTFCKMWRDVKTPEQAKAKIASQTMGYTPETATNLEEKAISLVGVDVYKKLIKGYTEKQWGRPCSELPPFIIERLPLRFTFDNNYFNDSYQGIPEGGYTKIVEKMLDGADVLLNTDYKHFAATHKGVYDKVIYTGAIDEYFDYRLGALEYRTLRFEIERLSVKDFQGNAVVNYTDEKSAYTRIIEHKHFEFGDQPTTVITREYPAEYTFGAERFYPVNNKRNNDLYEKYRALAEKEDGVYFCGRLGGYRYYDMDKTVEKALELVEKLG